MACNNARQFFDSTRGSPFCLTVSVPRSPSATLPPPRPDQGPARPLETGQSQSTVQPFPFPSRPSYKLARPAPYRCDTSLQSFFRNFQYSQLLWAGPALSAKWCLTMQPSDSHCSLAIPASSVGVWALPPRLLAGPVELLCEPSTLSPRPEPAINGGLMKALIYRSPLVATLGLCGWRTLLTAAGLCARKTTVRGWVALARERAEGDRGSGGYSQGRRVNSPISTRGSPFCLTVSVPRSPSATLPPPRPDQGPARPLETGQSQSTVQPFPFPSRPSYKLARPAPYRCDTSLQSFFRNFQYSQLLWAGPALSAKWCLTMQPSDSHCSLAIPASSVGVWALPPRLLAGPVELLCEPSTLSPRPEPAINGGLMKALIYRSPLVATLGLCGWRTLLTAAGLCARKTTVRGWVALARERAEGDRGSGLFSGETGQLDLAIHINNRARHFKAWPR